MRTYKPMALSVKHLLLFLLRGSKGFGPTSMRTRRRMNARSTSVWVRSGVVETPDSGSNEWAETCLRSVCRCEAMAGHIVLDGQLPQTCGVRL